MSKKRETLRKYHLTDAQLKQTADQLLLLIDRDAIEFADRNFNATKRAEFKAAIHSFENIDSDEILEGEKMSATEDKNAARDILHQKMKTALLMAKLVFGQNSGKYRTFGDTNYSDQTDDELCRNAQVMIKCCNNYLSDLAPEGMTIQRIQELTDAKNAFDEAIDKQATAINKRDGATSDRIDAGNALYSLVAKYAEIGKDIWYSVKEAYYNDYVIYDTIHAPRTSTNDAPDDSDDNVII